MATEAISFSIFNFQLYLRRRRSLSTDHCSLTTVHCPLVRNFCFVRRRDPACGDFTTMGHSERSRTRSAPKYAAESHCRKISTTLRMTRRVMASFYRSRIYLRFRYSLLCLLARSATQTKFFSFSVRSTPAKRSFAPAQPLVPELFRYPLLFLLARSATHAEGVSLTTVHCSLFTVHCDPRSQALKEQSELHEAVGIDPSRLFACTALKPEGGLVEEGSGSDRKAFSDI